MADKAEFFRYSGSESLLLRIMNQLSSLTTTVAASPLVAAIPPAHVLLANLKKYAVPASLGYVLLCRVLRFRRERSMRQQYGYETRSSLKKMTVEDAQKIVKDLLVLEMPFSMFNSLQFGLFKTYAVESISGLLLSTKNLTDPEASLKRFEDTGILIGEWMNNPPGSARAAGAIARMNWMHGLYKSKISDADLLFTLGVFIIEPERFARLYEWRPFNEMEICALALFWKSIGDAMKINYEGLLSKTEWEDGLDFYQDLVQWAKSYEVANFKPSKVSAEPARTLIPMIAYWVPKPMKSFVGECVAVLLGDRCRDAFLIPEPSVAANATTFTALYARQLYLRYLALPRICPASRHPKIGGLEGKDDLIQLNYSYGNYPFYIKPTIWNRWGPVAWAIWLAGGVLPGDRPDYYMAEGFKANELGPRGLMGKGKQEIELDQKSIMEMGTRGCPFG